MGSVIGEQSANSDEPKENKSLSDILKGSEERKGRSAAWPRQQQPTAAASAAVTVAATAAAAGAVTAAAEAAAAGTATAAAEAAAAEVSLG